MVEPGCTVAIIPVKALAAAKSRLAAALTGDERAALTLRMLGGVLDALAVPGVAARVVISPDPAVLAAARAAGAVALAQTTPTRGLERDLNEALETGRDWARAAGAGALLIVPGDLPALTAADVSALLAAGDGAAGVVLAPDRHGRGTNALLLRPIDALPFAFGVGSLARHRAAALARGLPVRLYQAPGTALDLDTPEDYAALRGRGRHVHPPGRTTTGE